jgi:endogenous inhibitor of DNA gyrase (YacG/DUF329 family)
MSGIKAYNYVEKCSSCGRKMLVSVFQFGVSHVGGISVLCPDCTAKVNWEEGYFKEHPEEVERIKEELKEDD